MRIDVETAANDSSEAVRTMLAELDDDGSASLAVLCGADLCALGLRSQRVSGLERLLGLSELDTAKREKFIEDRVQSMIDHGLLVEETPGRGYYPGARLTASPALDILLAAQRRPRFIIATDPTSRLQPVRYFAIGDGDEPLRGFVQEVPDRPGNDSLVEGSGILSDIYCYRLYRPDAAASCLAQWILKPTTPDDLRWRFPRGVTLLRPDSAADRTTYRFTIRGDGSAALADGPRLRKSAVYDEGALRALMLGLFERGSREPDRGALTVEARGWLAADST